MIGLRLSHSIAGVWHRVYCGVQALGPHELSSFLKRQSLARLFLRNALQDGQPLLLFLLHERKDLLRRHGSRVAADVS